MTNPSDRSDERGRSVRDVGVAIPAAGEGARMGGLRKAVAELAGAPLLRHALTPFLEHPEVGAIAVALPAELATEPPAWLIDFDPRIRVVAGGATRLESVRRALEALPTDVAIAVVHDAARPLLATDVLDRCLRVAREGEGAVAAWPVVDTLKEADDEGRVISTPDRSTLFGAQTPQAFPRAPLLDAYRRASEDGWDATDDAAVFARAGGTVRIVEGGRWNLKVTHPEDLAVAQFLLERREAERRDVATAEGAGPSLRILFLCTGNTCRSPIAEVLARAEAERRGWRGVEVRSAGVAAFPSSPASHGSRGAAARRGFDLGGHHATLLDPSLAAWADLVLAMSPSHLAAVDAFGARIGNEAGLLTSFAERGDPTPEPEDPAISDPFGGGDDVYEATWEELEALIRRSFDRLEGWTREPVPAGDDG